MVNTILSFMKKILCLNSYNIMQLTTVYLTTRFYENLIIQDTIQFIVENRINSFNKIIDPVNADSMLLSQ